MQSSRVVWSFVLSLLFVASVASAQGTTAVLQGVVTDSQGSVLPGVAVVATNTETGLTRDSVSDPAGFFRLTTLPPGRYQLHAELGGFEPYTRTGLVLTLGQTATADVKLGVASRQRGCDGRGQRLAGRHLDQLARDDGDKGAARWAAACRPRLRRVSPGWRRA